MTVGMTALAMTAATSAEYWPWSMIPRDRPNRAEIAMRLRAMIGTVAAPSGNPPDHA